MEADGEMTGAFYISTLIDITCQSLDPENCLPMDEGMYKKIHTPAPLVSYLAVDSMMCRAVGFADLHIGG